MLRRVANTIRKHKTPAKSTYLNYDYDDNKNAMLTSASPKRN